MIVTVTTTVTFELPKEIDDAVEFAVELDMTEWREIVDSGYVSYSKRLTVVKGDEKHGKYDDANIS